MKNRVHFKSHKSVNVESVANILLSLNKYIWSRQEFLRDPAVLKISDLTLSLSIDTLLENNSVTRFEASVRITLAF